MKITPICLLTACKRREFKLFWDSSQVRAIDNGITCCYWSASLSNRLRALKAHISLLKCCAKNRPNYMYWIQVKHRGSWVWVFLRLSVSLKLIFIVPFNFYSISIFYGIIRPVWKTGRIMPWQCLSVCPSVCPSVRPSAFSGLFFNMLWDINLKLGIYIQ